MRRLERWRWRLARWLAGDRGIHPWDLARHDRMYRTRDDRWVILDGSQGHTSNFGFHHGPRPGCPVCADRGGYTESLPYRFREPTR